MADTLATRGAYFAPSDDLTAICLGCAHCGCDPTDIDGYCVVCDDCDGESWDGIPAGAS